MAAAGLGKPPGAEMNTVFLLLAQYGRTIVPAEDVRRDYFGHMSPEVFARRVAAGEVPIPVVRMGDGQKAARGFHLNDLATYIDQQRAAAVKEFEQINRV